MSAGWYGGIHVETVVCARGVFLQGMTVGRGLSWIVGVPINCSLTHSVHLVTGEGLGDLEIDDQKLIDSGGELFFWMWGC